MDAAFRVRLAVRSAAKRFPADEATITSPRVTADLGVPAPGLAQSLRVTVVELIYERARASRTRRPLERCAWF